LLTAAHRTVTTALLPRALVLKGNGQMADNNLRKIMELTNCPMCQSSISSESSEIAKTCASCGADLTRWLPRRVTAPTPPVAVESPAVEAESMKREFNLGRGILGALIGAGVGVGVMYGFYVLAGFRFPLLGCGIGILTGYAAKSLHQGTETALGIISGGVALVAVVGTLYLMYGEFPIMSIISVIVSVSLAYRIASG
jgi:hypothetical protein